MHYLTKAGLEFLEEAKKMGLLKKVATVGALCVGASCKGTGASTPQPGKWDHLVTTQDHMDAVHGIVQRGRERDTAKRREARNKGMTELPDETRNARRMKAKGWLQKHKYIPDN